MPEYKKRRNKMRRSYNQKAETRIEGSKKKKVLIILILIIIVVAASFIVFRGCCNISIFEEPQSTPVYLEDEGDSIEGEAQVKKREEILKELEKQQLVVTDKLSSNISFTSGDVGAVGEWVVENPKENNVIQQAEVYLDEVLVAKTTPIYPNQHITGIKLLQEVQSGEYEVIAYINYYNIDTKEFISKAGYKVHLTVR
jgi:heme/copper-type cytochrome/quinol oxidase subunit 2